MPREASVPLVLFFLGTVFNIDGYWFLMPCGGASVSLTTFRPRSHDNVSMAEMGGGCGRGHVDDRFKVGGLLQAYVGLEGVRWARILLCTPVLRLG